LENSSNKSDGRKTINQIVKDRGYPFEKHFYETEDGYINMVIRISGPKGSLKQDSHDIKNQRQVVILQHGLMDSCAGWILNGPESLAYILADQGYDVWINNSRGNRYSRQHNFLDPDDDEQNERFFDYSFSEMAKYDQPALFNFVINWTGI
jgi:gastric triacylglycerol lipase